VLLTLIVRAFITDTRQFQKFARRDESYMLGALRITGVVGFTLSVRWGQIIPVLKQLALAIVHAPIT